MSYSLIALYQRDMWVPAFMALLRLRVPIPAEKGAKVEDD